MAKGIRSYGPGKFNHIIDQYVYEIVLDGVADRETSFPDGGGSFNLVEIDRGTRERIRNAAKENDDQLTKEEDELLGDSVAVVLFERSDGIVEAEWFDSLKEANEEWAAIEEEVAGDEEDEEDDGDEEVYEEEEEEEEEDDNEEYG